MGRLPGALFLPSGKVLAASVSSRRLLASKPLGPSLSAPEWDTRMVGVLSVLVLLSSSSCQLGFLPAGRREAARQMVFQIAK